MSRKVLNGLDLNSKQITNLADGSAANDAVNKSQLDSAIRGFSWKEEAKAASTANINLASPGATIDGVTMAANDRFVAKDQTTASQNGIYVWTGAATPATRALDADSGTELSGATITIQQGTVNADRVYRITTDDTITVDTTSIAWAQVGGGGVTYTADGNGIELSANQFSIELDGTTLTKSAAGLRIGSGAAGAGLTEASGVLAVGQGTGITVTADAVAIDPSVVVRKYAADCAATTNPQTFTHNLNTKDVSVQVREASTDAFVEADVTAPTVNTISVNFGGAPTAAQYRVIVQG